MTFKKSIFAFLASANALDLQSQTQTQTDAELEFLDFGSIVSGFESIGTGLYGIGESTIQGDIEGVGEGLLDVTTGTFDLVMAPVHGVINLGEGIVDLGEAGVDYIVSGDLVYDLNYIFSADFGNDLLGAGEYIFTGELFVDGWDWASDGNNWLLAGSTLLGTAGDVAEGDFTGAIDRATDPANYDVGIRTEEELRAAYADYEETYAEEVQPIKDDYDAAVAKKAENCDNFEPAVGSKPYPKYGTTFNYTTMLGM